MRITAISDLHGNLPTVPESDLLLLAGDLCPDNVATLVSAEKCAELQGIWLKETFIPWLNDLQVAETVMIFGNHDFIGQFPRFLPRHFGPNVTLLEDSITSVGGLTVYGTPWVGNIPMWAFNLPQKELAEKMSLIPSGLDILMTHNAPKGVGDFLPNYGNVGDKNLTRVLGAEGFVKPRLHVFGHIHEGRGSYPNNRRNVAFVDAKYKPYNLPIYETELEPNASYIAL